ncbi:hypothetical protein ACQ4LE_008679 [Meloidogyne hapla]
MSNTPLKFALITGANSGIGLHLAKSLFASDNFSSIVLACRDEKKANLAIEEIKKSVKDKKESSTNLNYLQLDLSSKTSVEQFVNNFCDVCPKNGLHLLVNNAGIMGHPYKLSTDGIEIHFATNHLGHFLLTNLLFKNQMFDQFARILILTSSYYEKFSSLLTVEELKSSTPLYSPNDYYAHSKFVNVLHSVGLAKRFNEEKVEIKVVAIRPGFIRGTQLGRHTNYFLRALATPLIWLFSKNLDQGISTILYCINCPHSELEPGKLYYENSLVTNLPSCINEKMADKLWELSEKLI